MKLSLGSSRPRNTALFIWLPELGCTFAKLALEELFRTLNGERFDLVDIFAAAIIATARIAFGIFVGEDRATGFKHRARGDVFRGDQLDLVALAAQLLANPTRNFGIAIGKTTGEEAFGHGVAGSGIYSCGLLRTERGWTAYRRGADGGHHQRASKERLQDRPWPSRCRQGGRPWR